MHASRREGGLDVVLSVSELKSTKLATCHTANYTYPITFVCQTTLTYMNNVCPKVSVIRRVYFTPIDLIYVAQNHGGPILNPESSERELYACDS